MRFYCCILGFQNCPHCQNEISVEDAQSGRLECPLCHGHLHIEREAGEILGSFKKRAFRIGELLRAMLGFIATTKLGDASEEKPSSDSTPSDRQPSSVTGMKSSPYNGMFIFVALAMMGIGGLASIGEFTTRTEGVYQQIAARIGMLGGVCLFGFGFLALVLCTRDKD